MLVATHYQQTKLLEAQKQFGAATWTARDLEHALKVNPVTAQRWLLEWERRGLLAKVETGENLWDRGAVRYRYQFHSPSPTRR